MSSLLVKNFEKEKRLVFYMNNVLLKSETRHTHMEKLVYALVMSFLSSRKLMPYLECHTIESIDTFSLREILHKPNLVGRMARWATKLGEHTTLGMSLGQL